MFSVLLFCLGLYWLYDLYPKIPRLVKELQGENPKVERWPAAVVLTMSVLLAGWMAKFLFAWMMVIFHAIT